MRLPIDSNRGVLIWDWSWQDVLTILIQGVHSPGQTSNLRTHPRNSDPVYSIFSRANECKRLVLDKTNNVVSNVKQTKTEDKMISQAKTGIKNSPDSGQCNKTWNKYDKTVPSHSLEQFSSQMKCKISHTFL